MHSHHNFHIIHNKATCEPINPIEIMSELKTLCITGPRGFIYLVFKEFYSLHVRLQFLPELFKSPWPVLVLSVPCLKGLAQPLQKKTSYHHY